MKEDANICPISKEVKEITKDTKQKTKKKTKTAVKNNFMKFEK